MTPEPTAQHGVVVEGDNVSPELADAAAAEINAAETGDAATEPERSRRRGRARPQVVR